MKSKFVLAGVLSGALLLSASALPAWSAGLAPGEPMVIMMDEVKGLTMIYDVRKLMTLISEGNKNAKPIVVIDVRDPQSYEAGHIGGAFNVPGGAILNSKDRDYLYYVVPDKSRTVVFIDDGVSEKKVATLDGYNVAKKAVEQGYKNVYCYGPGMRMWNFTKLPIVTGPEVVLQHMGENNPEANKPPPRK